jgi:hypothetical protein
MDLKTIDKNFLDSNNLRIISAILLLILTKNKDKHEAI